MADNTGSTQNPFEQLANQQGKAAPVASAPLPEIPKPVASPYTTPQPQSGTVQAGNIPVQFHGTSAADAQAHIIPPAAQSANPFEQAAAQKSSTGRPQPTQQEQQQKQDQENVALGYLHKAWGLAGSAVSKVPDWMVPAEARPLKQMFQEHPEEVAGVVKQMAESPLVHLQHAGTMPALVMEWMKQNRDSGRADLEGLPTGMVPSDEEFEAQAAKDFPKTYGIGKGVGALAEGLTSPENIALLAAMPEAKAAPYLSKLATMFFTGQMGKGTWDAAIDTAKNWDNLSPAERAEKLTEIFGQGAMTALSAAHLRDQFKGGEAKTETTPKKNRVLPTEVQHAGVNVPIPASEQAGGSRIANVFEQLATPGAKAEFQAEQTKPAARQALVSVLGQSVEDQVNAHNAIVDNEVKPAPKAGTQNPGKYSDPDEMWVAQQDAANRTYNHARAISAKEVSDWQARRDIAAKDVEQWNADPDNKDSQITEADLAIGDRPKTFDELRADLDEARAKLNPNTNAPDVITKAKTVDIPKAEKAIDQWFKDHEDQISNAEYRSAQKLWSDSENMKRIAQHLRGKLLAGTLTGNDIRKLSDVVDKPAVRRMGQRGLGTFNRLVGDQTAANIKEIAKLFDPFESDSPFATIAKSIGHFTMKGVLGYLLGGPVGAVGGEIAGTIGEKVLNHVLFDPEWGQSFRALAEATKRALTTDIPVPSAIVDRMRNLVQTLKAKYAASPLSREEGAVSLGGVKPRRTGDININPNADMRTAPNLEHDLRGFEEAKKESEEGRLPEGMSLLQRAQQLKEQYIAEAGSGKTEQFGQQSNPFDTAAQGPQNHVTDALNEFQRAAGHAPIDHTKVEVSKRAADIADAFDAMEHNPKDPKVKESYAALLDELKQQKAFLESKGYTFSLSDKDPYASYDEMMRDIIDNKHISVWTGGNELAEGHPLAKEIGGGWTGNTLLRAVHDVMGHAAGENDFSEKGEENAYNLHKQSFSEKARPALTTETKGQTSWFFNNKAVREGAPLGKFAEQKAGILPEPVEVHHWSNQPDLTETNPEMMGTGKVGAEQVRMSEPGFQKTTAFGTNDYREPRIQSQRYHYVASLDPTKYYDIEADPQGIWKKAFAKGGATAAEKAVRDAGYQGYRTTNQYRAFGKVPVRPATGAHVSSQELADYFNQNRGFTLNGNEGFMVNRKGYSVAGEYPQLDQVIPGQNITPEAIEKYRNRPDVKEALKDPRNSIGGWFYKGNAHLEISRLYKDRAEAIEAGKQLNQTAIYDHGAKKDIPLGGTAADEAAAAAAVGAPQMSAAAVAPALDKTASEIPTRRPWAKDTEQGLVEGQHANMDAFEQAHQDKLSGKTALGGEKMGYKEKMARTISKYPGMYADENARIEALKDPDAVISKFIGHLTGNLEWLWNQIPDEIRQQTRQWYDAANRILAEKANKYGFTHEQAAGVTARLSPQNPWDNNLHLADRMMDIYRNQQNHPYTDEMAAKSEELRKVPTQSAAFKKMLRDIKGKKLSQIKNADPDIQAAQKGLWIRLFDEAHGPDQVPSVSPTGEIVGYGSKPSWVGTDHVANAVKILENGSIRNIHDVMGDGHKIRNFYNNLINPNSRNGHVTIDTHATAAALLSPLGPKDAEAAHNFGGTTKGIPGAPSNGAIGLTGSYPLYAEAYQRVAKKLGIMPRELQSVIWEGIKSLMGDDKKTGALKARTREIWNDAAAGVITPEEAREQIKEASYGFAKPTWMSDEQWEKLGPESGDTGFNPEAMHQMTTLGTEHTVTGDVNPAGLSPEVMKWKGQPRPTLDKTPAGQIIYDPERLKQIADHANANDTPENMLNTTAHEVAHAFVSHHFGEFDLRDMHIGLGHRAVIAGEPLGEGLGPASHTGISGGFFSPGDGLQEAADASEESPIARMKFIQKYVTGLMAGRAMEETLGVDPQTVLTHASQDIAMARNILAYEGVPREQIGEVLDRATATAKQVLHENWSTVQHIVQQSVNHYGGELMNAGHFLKYRHGGFYGQP